MSDPLIAFALKLPLALLVFLVIAYAGTTDKRIAGVLFTFPILNGIAIIASPEPVVVADAIYPLVIFNCVLFALVISFSEKLPPVSALPRSTKLFARVATWASVWLAGAWSITDFRAAIPGAIVLFVAASLFAFVFIALCWTKGASTMAPAANSPSTHGTRFTAFWMNGTGLARMTFFVLAYAVLFFASRVALDEKWVGMASALPLPGFFALAALMDDAEQTGDPDGRAKLLPIRDTLFLGPVLVIPFNWTFSHALLSALPPDRVLGRYLLLLALWAIAALAVLALVPRLEDFLDKRRS
ncbi:MAG TPA: hypothetical protein VNM46_07495 [Xanthobacteraceae bacterium]|nr:hypothetical protein [Xanthobacteraceae bacterium]